MPNGLDGGFFFPITDFLSYTKNNSPENENAVELLFEKNGKATIRSETIKQGGGFETQ